MSSLVLVDSCSGAYDRAAWADNLTFLNGARLRFSPRLAHGRYGLAKPRKAARLRAEGDGSKLAARTTSRSRGTGTALPGASGDATGDHRLMNIERTTVEGDRTLALVAYVLHLVGAIAGITSIIGLIINYVKRDRYDDLFDSHHGWMIRSFWWAVVWIVIGCITIFILIGWVILFLVWLWYIYRHVRGLIALINGEPMPR
jgi:uncharacterized membrane protein